VESGVKPKTTAEIFQEAFPRYLAMGMSYAEYWEKESWLVKSYREAQKSKNNDINYIAWLHGVYVLDALHNGVPVVLNGIAKSHIDLPKYPEKPIELQSEKEQKRTVEKQQEEQTKLAAAKFMQFALQFNKGFKKRHETTEDKK